MKPFANDFKPERSGVALEKLPVGGYVCKILKAEEVQTKAGSKLEISFDIEKGDYRGFYKENWKAQTFEPKRWKGVISLWIPTPGDQNYDRSKKTFSNAIWAIEDSNPGYHWDWNEKALLSKYVGVIVGEREWELNGKSGITTVPRWFESVQNVEAGKFSTPRLMALKKKESDAVETTFTDATESNDELPF